MMRSEAESSNDLTWDGERFIPGMHGVTEIEHRHRYAAAIRLARGRRVLDVASGEGYGSALLSQVADHVTGVDISEAAVDHARALYRARNLEFVTASCTALPIDDASIDLIVSFETIEHHDEHEAMMLEFRRVLKSDGLLLISSPDKHEYSDVPGTHNEFHVRELYRDEFDALLQRHFNHVELYGQRVATASILAPLGDASATFEHFSEEHGVERPQLGIYRPVYFVALASNAALPKLSSSAYDSATLEIETSRDLKTFEAKMFWKTAAMDAYAEARSAAHRIPFGIDSTVVELTLPSIFPSELTGLRLDLADQPAVLLVTMMRLLDATGNVVWQWDGSKKALTDYVGLIPLHDVQGQGLIFVSLDSDPHVELVVAREATKQLAGGGRLQFAIRGTAIDDVRAGTPDLVPGVLKSIEQLWNIQQEMSRLDRLLVDRDRAIDAINLELQSRRQATLDMQATYEATIARYRVDVAQLNGHIALIYASKSWRLMGPLRRAARLARRVARAMRSHAAKSTRMGYRLLPVPDRVKVDGKGFIFNHTGSIFERTAAYQRWRAHNESGRRGASVPTRQVESSAGVQGRGQVDGCSEWSRYPSIIERIQMQQSAQRSTAVQKSIDMIEFDAGALSEEAGKLRFPTAVLSPKVSIIVPVFGQIKYTLECLRSILDHASTNITFEVIVADDASNDNTQAMLDLVANLKIVRQPSNLGFLRNCNAAAATARGELLVFLNNDVQVQAGWLEALVDLLESQQNIGVVGPKIVYPNGCLQDAGSYLHRDGRAEMVGHGEDPALPRFNYVREVEYCSGACLMIRTDLFRQLNGFDELYAPAYCEDSDLCLRVSAEGFKVVYCPTSVVVHHLSKTSDAVSREFKLACVGRNLNKLSQRWQDHLDLNDRIRFIAFYLPQFHPIPENDLWWGKGFTEWRNAAKAVPNFEGHYQPHRPADLGYYDLRAEHVMKEQAELASRYGLAGMCFYYYWFAGKRLLEMPLERLLQTGEPDLPFCLCWANENWTRRWDGMDQEILTAQNHSDQDDLDVIDDLIRYFRHANYIRINGRPLLLVYRVTLFPDFAVTAARWRKRCRDSGIGEIYLAMVESFELSRSGSNPDQFGCDAAVEFPPQGFAERIPVPGPLLNPDFSGAIASYDDIAVSYATRTYPSYKRFHGVMPGWDNTPRRQDSSLCFHDATPGTFQAWTETVAAETRAQFVGEERIVFINAWNEWAEGAHLEPDQHFGHAFLQALANAQQQADLVRRDRYALD